jgi:hypothetical protein
LKLSNLLAVKYTVYRISQTKSDATRCSDLTLNC